jgi:hypothetical protein
MKKTVRIYPIHYDLTISVGNLSIESAVAAVIGGVMVPLTDIA